ncbi:P-loop containing nucleoside triphosphate hydrolase protein [Apiospora marii]|uniref:P-loop containing nucleoside triphosphate hydrolase protein n=1 Tax=Apiospora marii TaxID=335849 RepID=UPI00313079BB
MPSSKPHHTITRADFDTIIGDCEAVTDMPCVNFARELIEAFPEAEVSINTRELDAWYTSCQSTFERYRGGWSGFHNRARSWFCAELYWLRRNGEYNFERFWDGVFHATVKWRYREHVAMVKGSVQANWLLERKVQDGW